MVEIWLTNWKITYRKTKTVPYSDYTVYDVVSIKPYDHVGESRMKRGLPPEVLACLNKDVKVEVTYRKLIGHTNKY